MLNWKTEKWWAPSKQNWRQRCCLLYWITFHCGGVSNAVAGEFIGDRIAVNMSNMLYGLVLKQHLVTNTNCLNAAFIQHDPLMSPAENRWSLYCSVPVTKQIFRTTAQNSNSQAGWSDKMKGNISQHCVAGQNAIRDKDAEHNWVWHMLIAFHLDKFGSTV